MTSEVTSDPVGRGNILTADWAPIKGDADGTLLAAAGVQNNVQVTTFNGGDTSIPTYDHIISQDGQRIQWVHHPRRNGFGSVRLEVRTGDIGGTTTNRTTIESTNDTSTWLYPGDDVWIGQSFYFPDGYVSGPVDSNGWMLLYQLFASSADFGTQGGSPPLDIETVYGTNYGSPTGADLSLAIRGGDKASSGATSPRQNFYHFAPLLTGVWHDVMIHAQFGKTSGDTNGRIRLWHKLAGEAWPITPTLDHSGKNVTSINGVDLPMYHNMNLYRSNRTENQVLYFGGQVCRRTRHECEEFFYGLVVDEKPKSGGFTHQMGEDSWATLPLDIASDSIGVSNAGDSRSVRVTIPKTGTLSALYTYVALQNGNMKLAVYDTGQATGSGTRTKLWSSASAIDISAATNTWKGDTPNIPVTEGDTLDFHAALDGTTARLCGSTRFFGSAQATLPSGFIAAKGPGTASPKVASTTTSMYTTPPSTISEGNNTASGNAFLFIFRIT